MGWWGNKRLWLFSGSFKDPDGTTVDINPKVNPDVVANCEKLPFKDGSFDFVMLDPPYSEKESKDLYNLPYCGIVKVVNEAARVCKTGGYVVCLHRLVPWSNSHDEEHKRKLKMVAIVGVFTFRGYTNIRALSVMKKGRFLPHLLFQK